MPLEYTDWKKAEVQGPLRPDGGTRGTYLRPIQLETTIFVVNFAIALNNVPPVCHFKGRKEMFYLTTHLTHFIYSYMASDIW